MANERNTGFVLSLPGRDISSCVLTAADFKRVILSLPDEELPGYLRSHVRSRVPAAFASRPLLWENVRTWLAAHLCVDPHEIGLTGSGQIGFSASPKQFGKEFSKSKSDLDFFVISDVLFGEMISEVRTFCSETGDQHLSRFAAQIATLQKQFARGFFDLKQVPATWEKYPRCSRANNIASIVVDKLKHNEYELEHSFFRVYETWHAFSRQTLVTYKALRAELR